MVARDQGGFGYKIENGCQPKAGYIRLRIMNREGCPGRSPDSALSGISGKDINILAGWTTKEQSWNVNLFTVKIQIFEDGGGNTCIRANPEVRVEADERHLLRQTDGPTYYNPKAILTIFPPRETYTSISPITGMAALKSIFRFPGISYSAYYSYQGFKEDRAAVCSQYARRGVEQNQENLAKKCGYSGSAWHSDYNSHYGWCMTAERSAIDGGTRFRDDELKKCGAAGDNRARCDQYARTAVAQNQENLNRKCGFGGDAWNANYNAHFDWCMRVDRSWPDSENRKRQESLNRCAPRQTHDFRNPSVRGYRVDRCLYWGRDCDKPAADRFCRDNGFAEAESWGLAQARPTLILGDGQICNADYCGGFSYIRCVKPR